MAAAALTGGNPFKTMLLAWKYTLPAFVVPFMFTVHPDGLGLLLKAPAADVIKVVFTSALGLAAMASGINGWLVRRTSMLERAALIVAGVLFIYPATSPDLIALVLVGGVLAFQLLAKPVTTTTG
jgi:TRAP-type uncharacterized transport system fused permease subunit